ncbi:MAG: PEP/pyruvate-binding domain-containing protein [Phycisphaerae bacterium]
MSDRRRIYAFDEPLPADVDARAILGGKGASLKEMTLAGLDVPPGFTITTEVCRSYHESGRRRGEGLDDELRQHLWQLEHKTGRTFGRGPTPLLVGVRSGAARSMPGMMDTLLNCGLTPDLADDVGDTEQFWRLYEQFVRSFATTARGLEASAFEAVGDGPPDRRRALKLLEIYREQTGMDFPTRPWDVLVQCVEAVLDSWNSHRAVAYRRRHNITDLTGTAVNVQEMFPSQVSGIVFTVEPTGRDERHMVIEAGYGLGESIVSGDITPDRYYVDRRDPSQFTCEVGHKHAYVAPLGASAVRGDPHAPCLSDEQVSELHELAMRVERHYGRAMDIEWGWADGRFALLQARPIRGLEVARAVEPLRREEIRRLAAMSDGRRKVWVLHNLDETLRHPTPMTWSIVRSFMSGAGGFGRMYAELGYRCSERVAREGFLELIGGRIYSDPQRQAELFFEAMPLTYDTDALREDPSLLDGAPREFDPSRADGRFLLKLPATLASMARVARRTRRLRPQAAERFDREAKRFSEYVRGERDRRLEELSDAELLDELESRIVEVLHRFAAESLLPGFFGGMARDRLEGRLVQLMGEESGRELVAALTRALDGDTTFQQDCMLYEVARGRASVEEFVSLYGHRCVGEMELARPRWREDHRAVEELARRLAGPNIPDPREVHERNAHRRDEAVEKLPELLAEHGGSCFREEVLHDLRDAQRLLPYREIGKHYLMMGYELIRRTLRHLADRWEMGDDVFFLDIGELRRAAEGRDFSQEIAERRLRWEALQRLDMAEVIDSADLENLGLAPEPTDGEDLAGTAVAGGVASGPAAVVTDPAEAGELPDGYVLVCPSTDPGWTPLFAGARALIVERGGVLSHGAIVARDFGIPAVVRADATRIIRNGQTVHVDGNSGRIRLADGEVDRV